MCDGGEDEGDGIGLSFESRGRVVAVSAAFAVVHDDHYCFENHDGEFASVEDLGTVEGDMVRSGFEGSSKLMFLDVDVEI